MAMTKSYTVFTIDYFIAFFYLLGRNKQTHQIIFGLRRRCEAAMSRVFTDTPVTSQKLQIWPPNKRLNNRDD